MAVTEAPLDVKQTRPGRPADPCIMVIFGAGGDLTSRKLIPALYNLAKAELLSREFAIVGTSHSAMSNEQFRQKVGEDIKQLRGRGRGPGHRRMVCSNASITCPASSMTRMCMYS